MHLKEQIKIIINYRLLKITLKWKINIKKNYRLDIKCELI